MRSPLRLGEDGGFWTSGSRLSGGKRLDLDTLVLATHGGPGEDGTLQGALDLAGLAYTGPTVAGAALGMDKWAFSAVIANAGLASLPRALLSASSTSLPFAGPYILKPRFGGSSIGIDVVADFATAQARLSSNPHFANGCVVEPYREDLSDVQIALRTYPSLELSAIERPIRRTPDAEILNYRDKYVGGEGMVAAPRELPAVLPAGAARGDSVHGARDRRCGPGARVLRDWTSSPTTTRSTSTRSIRFPGHWPSTSSSIRRSRSRRY